MKIYVFMILEYYNYIEKLIYYCIIYCDDVIFVIKVLWIVGEMELIGLIVYIEILFLKKKNLINIFI